MKKVAIAAVLSVSACAYAPMAGNKDGTTYVVKRFGLLGGLLDKVYACAPNATQLACKELAGRP